MQPTKSFPSLDWEDIYPYGLWHLWLNRNSNNLNNNSKNVSLSQTLNRAAELKYLTGTHHPSLNVKNNIIITWQKPSMGSYKLNCDSAYNINKNINGLEGVIRNSHGQWILGFQSSLTSLVILKQSSLRWKQVYELLCLLSSILLKSKQTQHR